MSKCPVCAAAAPSHEIGRDVWLVDCPRCSRFQITEEAVLNFPNSGGEERKRAIISSQIRKLPKDVVVTTEVYERLAQAKDISFTQKSTNLLLFLSKITSYAGEVVNINPHIHSAIAESWAMNLDELSYLLLYLEQEARISPNITGVNPYFRILHAGWKFLEDLGAQTTDSNQGFVAMWFNESMRLVYDDCISISITDAGYTPHRVDQNEHINRIDDEIITQIRRSKFVVADATGHRGGVYYEAGFATGLGLPVFWTCRVGDELHFDVRQYNCIFWTPDSLPQFRVALSRRIEAVLGRGKS